MPTSKGWDGAAEEFRARWWKSDCARRRVEILPEERQRQADFARDWDRRVKAGNAD